LSAGSGRKKLQVATETRAVSLLLLAIFVIFAAKSQHVTSELGLGLVTGAALFVTPELLEQQRLTVADLAGRSDISPTRVAKLEAGLTDPRFDVLVALSDGLGVGLSALIPDDEEGQAS
jgi:hypothetical protein